VPGGRPTFWTLVALLVLGAGGVATMRLRSPAEATTDEQHDRHDAVGAGGDRARR
jgi:hypothetical protein